MSDSDFTKLKSKVEHIDESAREGDCEVIVLDQDASVTFTVGMTVSVDSLSYEIKKKMIDPAKSTHTLKLRLV